MRNETEIETSNRLPEKFMPQTAKPHKKIVFHSKKCFSELVML